jgi:hypothetical protein
MEDGIPEKCEMKKTMDKDKMSEVEDQMRKLGRR